MPRSVLSWIPVVSLVVASCGTGGLEFWLYPEPRLARSEEAVFIVHEDHRVIAIDEDETGVRCWGDREGMGAQAYRTNDRLCRIHLLPGQHFVLVRSGTNVREMTRLEFTALAGKSYGLRRSNCMTPPGGYQQTCRVEVVEVEDPRGGG